MTKNEILESLGVQDIAAFDSGNLAWYKYQIGTANVDGYLQFQRVYLTASILTINSQKLGDSVLAFRLFYQTSRQLAKEINASQLEILGIAFINEELKNAVIKRGFTAKQVVIPEELGNDGTVECYSKTTDMR